MSKKIIAVCVALSALTLSSSAFASRARELVMGTADPFGVLSSSQSHGSFFYEDNYNIFYNPAYTNDFKNWASIEKSNAAGLDATGTPAGTTAEGGLVASMMNVNVGAYFNRGDTYTMQNTTRVTRPIDLMVGTDLGAAKIGLGLTYANAHAEPSSDAYDATIHAGAEVMDLDPFVSVRLMHQSNSGATAKQTSITVGTRYHWGEWVPFAAWQNLTGDGVTGKPQNFGAGLGRDAKLTDDVMMDYAVSYWHTTNGVSRSILPINMALEANLASWITGRAGLTYNLYDRTSGSTTGDTTSGRIGATIHAGKANIDFAIGNTPAIASTTLEAKDLPGTNAQVLGIGPEMFYALGASYSW